MITKRKKKTCYCKWKIDDVVERLQKLEQSLSYYKDLATQTNRLVVYSADTETAINNTGKWHQIVCVYKDGRCEGGQRPHWHSHWDIRADGFHLVWFLNEKWEGWHGQYKPHNQLKYDELPRDVLMLHHNALIKHLEKFGLFYPCHIYNDFTGELYRP